MTWDDHSIEHTMHDSDGYTPHYVDDGAGNLPSPDDPEWWTAPSGDPCPWCQDINSDVEPEDDDDAEMLLCRGHLAEYTGVSLNGLDRMEDEQYRDTL